MTKKQQSFGATKETKWQIFNSGNEVATLKKDYAVHGNSFSWNLHISYAEHSEMIELLEYVKKIVELENGK